MSKVKLQFEADLDYQHRAIEAVCGLFEGQGNGVAPFTVMLPTKNELNLDDRAAGTGNKLGLQDEEILANLRTIQERNGQELSTGKAYTILLGEGKKKKAQQRVAWDFTVEMETGTGKTYVYLRTIYELNKRYGFSKFIIVVPSIAIKEGVFKSIELMRDHFHGLYDGVAMHATQYDSARIGEVCNYARSSKLEIMVCTVQAITDIRKEKEDAENFSDTAKRKAKRVMYTANEKTGGAQPIEYIRQCYPIVIVDEPQNVGEKSEMNGIALLNPLCTLRYSATHRNLCHPIYSLNAVESAARKLVKSIEVAGMTMSHQVGAMPYIRVKKVGEKKGKTYARLTLMVDLLGKRQDKPVYVGDDLALASGNELYSGIRVQQIREDGVEFVPDSVGFIRVGQDNASTENEQLVREMIRETIKRHLAKAALLRPKGIKVLSLFFLDSVANYRVYDEDGRHAGPYAKIFKEEYAKWAALPQYRSLWSDGAPPDADVVHDGYFSIDKATKTKAEQWTDTKENDRSDAAKRAYELIMRDKERLLSMDEPLQFIFSHTALREGWDNPNVFQVCVLRDVNSLISRRQIIGRGLRICVDSHGRRVREDGVNRLTVVANEDYRVFAANLQTEYEEEGLRFGVITQQLLGAITLPSTEPGKEELLGQEQGKKVLGELLQNGVVDGSGKLTEVANKSLQEGTFTLPNACVANMPAEQQPAVQQAIMQVLREATRTVAVSNAHEKRELKVRDKWRENTHFLELWERLKTRTIFEVKFSTEELIHRVVKNVQKDLLSIPPVLISIGIGGIVYRQGGLDAKASGMKHVVVDTSANPVPDIVSELVDKTNLTRRTVVRILRKLPPELLNKVRDNCAEFLRRMIARIQTELQALMVDGICYRPVIIGEREYGKQLFLTNQQVGDLQHIIETSEKCLTEHIVCDSGSTPEREFAHDADLDESVKFYVKLPDKFTIPTPLGNYNPDWAMVKQEDGQDMLYFVVETKSSNLSSDLRTKEQLKIDCAKVHFKSLAQNTEQPIKFCGPVSKLHEVF